jgi:toxin ParE1/3/4
MRVGIRPEAWLDIEETVNYLNEKSGSEPALEFYRLAKKTIKDLARQPRMGRPRRDLKPPGIRSWRVAPPFDKWLIFYQLTGEALEILRLKHGATDLPTLFEG